MVRASILPLLLFFTWFPHGISQHDASPRLIGDLRSWKPVDHGIQIHTGEAVVRILCYSPSVVRVRMVRGSFEPDFSYAVIREPEGEFTSVDETPEELVVRTPEMEVHIRKKPLRILFLNGMGEVLSEEFTDFGVTWLGDEVTCHRVLFPDERFIGLGEKTGPLDRRGQAYVNWNRDIPGYSDREDPLYQSIPFFIGIHDSLTYGIFLDNSYKTHFNFGASTDDLFSFFSAERGELDYFFFGKQTISGILEDYTWLTGRMPLPPYWSLGYQQCRWGYYPAHEVISLARKFRDKAIPCDVIYLDIDYMDRYKIFTWHPERFPEPERMVAGLSEMGFHTVVIVDPGIKIEEGYTAYDEGVSKDCFIRYPGGRLYTGNVWPGRCHFPDFTKPATRSWWGEQFQSLVRTGIEGFWNDMNEPSAWGQDIPDIVAFDFDGHPTTMAEAHNVYGLEMSRATFEGARKYMNGKRPFVLTRAGFSGIQRYSAVWSGDNSATDADLLQGVRLTTSMGLSGIPFTGPDVGGFMGSPSKELFLRWLSVGVYTPFFRNHSVVNSRDQEPWSFGEDAEEMARRLIGFRYRLLPYLYTLFHTAAETGLPVARSLAIEYPFDPKVYDWRYQNQFLLGSACLVAPVTSEQKFQKVYLPSGTWFRYSSGEMYPGTAEVIVEAPLDDLPVFIRGGAILPLQSVVQYTGQPPEPVLDLHLYNGMTGSDFLLYEDDGTTYAYQHGDFRKRTIRFDPVGRTLSFSPPEGNFPGRFRQFRLLFHGFDGPLPERMVGNDPGEITIRF